MDGLAKKIACIFTGAVVMACSAPGLAQSSVKAEYRWVWAPGPRGTARYVRAAEPVQCKRPVTRRELKVDKRTSKHELVSGPGPRGMTRLVTARQSSDQAC